MRFDAIEADLPCTQEMHPKGCKLLLRFGSGFCVLQLRFCHNQSMPHLTMMAFRCRSKASNSAWPQVTNPMKKVPPVTSPILNMFFLQADYSMTGTLNHGAKLTAQGRRTAPWVKK